MTCYNFENGIICIVNIEFDCPSCKKKYDDRDDKYLNRCNKNKNGCTRIKCDCGTSFYMTYDYKGDTVSFRKEGNL